MEHDGPKHTYYTDIDENHASEGRMVTGFVYVPEKKATYYFNPIDHIIDHSKYQAPKDYDGHQLALGEAVTGWIYSKHNWYYAAKEHILGDVGHGSGQQVFEKRQIITSNTLSINGKKYVFDGTGICQKP